MFLFGRIDDSYEKTFTEYLLKGLGDTKRILNDEDSDEIRDAKIKLIDVIDSLIERGFINGAMVIVTGDGNFYSGLGEEYGNVEDIEDLSRLLSGMKTWYDGLSSSHVDRINSVHNITDKAFSDLRKRVFLGLDAFKEISGHEDLDKKTLKILNKNKKLAKFALKGIDLQIRGNEQMARSFKINDASSKSEPEDNSIDSISTDKK